MADRPAGDLFSWRGKLARRDGLAPGALIDDELVTLMASDPGYLRRPVLQVGSRFVAGFDASAWSALLTRPSE